MAAERNGIIDQLVIRQEPRGLLGRYFLAVEQELLNLGLTLRLQPVAALVEVHRTFADSWNGLTPALNTSYAPIPDDTAACLIAYDSSGVPAACHACRFIDLGAVSVKDALADLTCFFGPAAAELRTRHRWLVDTPTAARMTGRIVYTGAFWVRRSLRRSRVGEIIQDVSRFYACSQWSFAHEVSIGSKAFRDPAIQQRYHFAAHEPDVTISVDGRIVMQDAVFMFTPVDTHLSRLPGLIAEAERALASAAVDRDEQRVRA